MASELWFSMEFSGEQNTRVLVKGLQIHPGNTALSILMKSLRILSSGQNFSKCTHTELGIKAFM